MKVKWSVDGAGCQHAQCGLEEFTVEIPDNELDGLTDVQRDQVIDEWIDDEFRQKVGPHWEIVT